MTPCWARDNLWWHKPSDPTIYRFHEALAVYGPALKELIHEEFGDGIMSAINFKVDIACRSDPAGTGWWSPPTESSSTTSGEDLRGRVADAPGERIFVRPGTPSGVRRRLRFVGEIDDILATRIETVIEVLG